MGSGRGFREKCVEPHKNGLRITQPKEKFLPNPRQPVRGWCPAACELLSSLDLHLCSVTGDVLIACAKDMFSWHRSEVIQSLLRPLLLKLSYCMPIKSLHHTILHEATHIYTVCVVTVKGFFFLKAEVCNKWHPFKHIQTLHFSTFCLTVLLQPQLLYFVMKFMGLCIPKLCVCVDCYLQGGLGEKKQIRCSNLITGYNKS